MSTAMSDKAKGKQRATKLEPEPEPEATLSKDLTIRFTEGIPDLIVQVAEKDTVKDLKKSIRLGRPELKDRRLRLIHSGQLLSDNVHLYSRVASREQKRKAPQASGSSDESDAPAEPSKAAGPTWIHCSVGPPLEEGEEEDSRVQTAQLKPLRGFDRLATAGFSEQDIATMRLQFHAHSSGDYIDQEFDNQEDFDEHARVLEEQWIDSLDGPSASISNSQPGVSAMHNGIVLGFFFPLIPLFFFRGNKPALFWDDDSEHETMSQPVFSRRLQMGIVVGFILNVTFGVWTYLLSSS